MKLLLGDCLDKLKELDDNSVDSIVTDPPYGLLFMGKKWDCDVPSQEIWEECMRVLKPGGHLLAFAGSRTYHRMAVRVEDAGFEIRDQIMWVYGTGFPKSINIGHKLDNYNGWGTALKPAHEPIVMARKPLSEKTVVDNVLEWGTGGINIDESRIETDEELGRFQTDGNGPLSPKYGFNNNSMSDGDKFIPGNPNGRFPANIIFDEEAGKILDEQTGVLSNAGSPKKTDSSKTSIFGAGLPGKIYSDIGGASRFFYCPKASKKDRDEGMEDIQPKSIKGRDEGQDKTSIAYKARPTERHNIHPTVKPTDLMLYLIRLVTPKGGTTLDPFMGSGSTGKAAIKGGFDFIGIEREQEYFDIAKARIGHENNNLFKK